MADLDDFFAKRDKKKSKTKKFLTADELVKKLEDTSKRAAEPAPPKSEPVARENPSSETGENVPEEEIVNAEEEWKDFQEEARKDYTGLKIVQLNIDDNASDVGSDGDAYGDDDSGDERADGKSGPWKKVIPAEEVTQIPVEIEKPSSRGVYISPALRNAASLSSAPKSVKVRNRNAPDITNADFFPTLGAARPEEQKKKKNEPAFEEVRHGGRMQRVPEAQTTGSAPIANRFKSLEEDDS